MNEITAYRGRTKIFGASIPAGYSGYTATFTVNNKEFNDGTPVFSISGITITNQIATINVSKTQNDIDERVYFYQVDIIKGALKYTIAQSSYTVLPTII